MSSRSWNSLISLESHFISSKFYHSCFKLLNPSTRNLKLIETYRWLHQQASMDFLLWKLPTLQPDPTLRRIFWPVANSLTGTLLVVD